MIVCFENKNLEKNILIEQKKKTKKTNKQTMLTNLATIHRPWIESKLFVRKEKPLVPFETFQISPHVIDQRKREHEC